jgi:hypothetical protein
MVADSVAPVLFSRISGAAKTDRGITAVITVIPAITFITFIKSE